MARLKQKYLRDSGFTLVEALIVVIILGILAAIAAPNLLSLGNKAKESEAKQMLADGIRQQRSKYTSRGSFASVLPNSTGNHYSLSVSFGQEEGRDFVLLTAIPFDPTLETFESRLIVCDGGFSSPEQTLRRDTCN